MELKKARIVTEDLEHRFNLSSAYETILGEEQKYCRKNRHPSPVVEYVWHSKNLIPLGVVPIKPDLASKYALEVMSSDHHPLVVDLTPC